MCWEPIWGPSTALPRGQWWTLEDTSTVVVMRVTAAHPACHQRPAPQHLVGVAGKRKETATAEGRTGGSGDREEAAGEEEEGGTAAAGGKGAQTGGRKHESGRKAWRRNRQPPSRTWLTGRGVVRLSNAATRGPSSSRLDVKICAFITGWNTAATCYLKRKSRWPRRPMGRKRGTAAAAHRRRERLRPHPPLSPLGHRRRPVRRPQLRDRRHWSIEAKSETGMVSGRWRYRLSGPRRMRSRASWRLRLGGTYSCHQSAPALAMART